MSLFRVSRLGGAMLLSGLMVLLAIKGVSREAIVNGRILTDSEMARVFCDDGGGPIIEPGSDPCKKQYTCDTGFVTGTQCGWCDGNTGPRQMCCSLGAGTTCDYTGPAVCSGLVYREGPNNGSGSTTCNSCTSSAWSKQGNCSNLKDAAGGACP